MVLQSFATGLLLTAHLANLEYSAALADAIQVRTQRDPDSRRVTPSTWLRPGCSHSPPPL